MLASEARRARMRLTLSCKKFHRACGRRSVAVSEFATFPANTAWLAELPDRAGRTSDF